MIFLKAIALLTLPLLFLSQSVEAAQCSTTIARSNGTCGSSYTGGEVDEDGSTTTKCTNCDCSGIGTATFCDDFVGPPAKKRYCTMPISTTASCIEICNCPAATPGIEADGVDNNTNSAIDEDPAGGVQK
jgi:hypothetical protein